MPAFPPPPSVLMCPAAPGGWCPGPRLPRAVEDGWVYFPQSVASGEPDADGVVLWTRAVDPTRPHAPLVLTLQVARDARFEHRVLEVEGLVTTPARDHTVKVRVTNLAPSTRYHYRFLLEREGQWLCSPGGRTRTGPASCQARPLDFVVASYQELLGQEEGLWRRLLRRDAEPDFILLPGHSLRGEGVDLCRRYRAHPILREVHARHPFIVLWEDGAPGGAWGRAARRTWCDYLPVGLPGDVSAAEGSAGAWRPADAA